MKTINIFIIISIAICSFTIGCSKNSDTPSGNDNNNNNKTYPAPHWEAVNAAAYAYSMTAVITIPDSLKQTLSADDEFAAFVGDECRGTGTYIERSGSQPAVFYVLIKGAADESGSVTFKYYNKKSAYLYTTGNIVSFEIDDNYGTVDDPAMPGFKPM